MVDAAISTPHESATVDSQDLVATLAAMPWAPEIWISTWRNQTKYLRG